MEEIEGKLKSLEAENEKLKEIISFKDELSYVDNETIRNLNSQNAILKDLLQRLYDSASKLDLEYCYLINNYYLEEYGIPQEYDDVWMENFIKAEKYLGIE